MPTGGLPLAKPESQSAAHSIGPLDPQLCGRICLRLCQIGHFDVREGVTEGGVGLGPDFAAIHVGVRT